MKSRFLPYSIFAVSTLLWTGCSQQTPAATAIDKSQLALFQPLPESVPAKNGPAATGEMISLGRMLYFEKRLSRSQEISCNSCHPLDKYGVDNQRTSPGHKGQRGDRNSPTVYNAAAHFVQFWDGRAAHVEAQAKGPVLNPVEMAMKSEADVVAVLTSIPEYVAAFGKAFPKDKNPVTYDNMATAIGAFERKLVTPSRWDAFLKGDGNALTQEEKAGFQAFYRAGCQTCHMGVNLGGSSYQKLGAVKPYEKGTDPGRFHVTKNEADRNLFKVPGLRNVERTGPYFHDGNVASLAEAVKLMGELQLGKQLHEQDTRAIVAWLRTLTGQLPAEYIQAPALPPSTAKTPKPDLT